MRQYMHFQLQMTRGPGNFEVGQHTKCVAPLSDRKMSQVMHPRVQVTGGQVPTLGEGLAEESRAAQAAF
jgi:hypothetical protein